MNKKCNRLFGLTDDSVLAALPRRGQREVKDALGSRSFVELTDRT
ncbi:MAG: hypothetical protein ACI915_000044 [Gammaproteobacteria bacterium]|jgi:hypothetical protein